ncbi:c-type cytochrome [Roseibium sp. M-1]
MKRILLAVLLLLVAAAVGLWMLNPADLATRSSRFEALQPTLHSDEDKGVALFAFGDFGALTSDTLQTSAAPWKLMVAALALQETGGNPDKIGEVEIAALFRRFGFHSPSTIENWPDTLPQPDLSVPLGLNTGVAEHAQLPVAVTISNSGCAACHSSVVYRPDGSPDPSRVWLGMPNGSINLEAYTEALYAAFRDQAGDSTSMLAAVQTLFPDTTWAERQTLRFALLPVLKKEIEARAEKPGRLLPFHAGVPGATNGLDALKLRLGLIDKTTSVQHSVANSVPDLGGRLWRRSFLNTATYAPPGTDQRRETVAADITPHHLRQMAPLVAYFTVPSMGVSNETAEAHIGDAENVLAWAAGYRPQPFPGTIDRAKLQQGREIFAANCSACHGRYDDSLAAPALVSFPNWQGDVGTDPRRIELTDEEVATAVNAGSFGRYINAQSASSYVAPPLTGIWASAPYLHNGSVPTLWHLMHPETRPDRFSVGGHALDLEKAGLQGIDDGQGGWLPPASYEPWAMAVEIDTGQYGLSHDGHADEFTALSTEDRAALLEYLKLL